MATLSQAGGGVDCASGAPLHRDAGRWLARRAEGDLQADAGGADDVGRRVRPVAERDDGAVGPGEVDDDPADIEGLGVDDWHPRDDGFVGGDAEEHPPDGLERALDGGARHLFLQIEVVAAGLAHGHDDRLHDRQRDPGERRDAGVLGGDGRRHGAERPGV